MVADVPSEPGKDEQRLIVVAYRERATHDHSDERVDVRFRKRTPFGYAAAPGRERPSSSTAQPDHVTSSARLVGAQNIQSGTAPASIRPRHPVGQIGGYARALSHVGSHAM